MDVHIEPLLELRGRAHGLPQCFLVPLPPVYLARIAETHGVIPHPLMREAVREVHVEPVDDPLPIQRH